ncbi:hypothetical protein [Nocardia sp. XZ_19_385]|uniref:hypothetical protein n=1 Tax=Nocardia sp. XZ_19_385 TaxID=2769488 RepID=UPI0018909F86|nr:hypothetical protein [Nocardia sp. XZ_19_385]
MISTLSSRIIATVSACAIILLIPACTSDADKFDNLTECGNLRFPDAVELVSYHEKLVGHDQVLVAVVDMSADQVAEFKQRSELVRFKPGVPISWLEQWDGADVLKSEAGNEHLVDPNPWLRVAIHDSGGQSRRVFLSLAC